MPCRIELGPIELSLNIGCTEAERLSAQPILFKVTIDSPEYFRASLSDNLEDTLDVESVRQGVLSLSTSSFKTLERLAKHLEEALRKRLPPSALRYEVRIEKPKYGWSYVHTWTA